VVRCCGARTRSTAKKGGMTDSVEKLVSVG
jgi:hypothetical protein